MKKTIQIELAISAELAWIAFGEKFAETGQWTSALDSSHMVGELAIGGYRVCTLNGNELTEQITKFDADNMTLEYELISGRPIIIKSGKNRWSVKPLGPNRCTLFMSPTIEVKWWAVIVIPILSLGLKANLSKVMEEFKYWAETGEVHPRKKAQQTPLG